MNTPAFRLAGVIVAGACLMSSPPGMAEDARKSSKEQPAGQTEVLPATPEQQTKLLADLYAELARAKTAAEAAPLAAAIERLWVFSGSDTIDLLMERSLRAMSGKDTALALELLDVVVDLAPDYAEGWNRRAYVLYSQNEVERALGDLRRVLALEPKHFKALDGLGQILREAGEKKGALEAFRELERVNPRWPGIRATVDELDREVEGQGI